MEAKIAIATVSGKAYYLLVNELKDRKVNFLSLTPHENIPTNIEVVITTETESKLIKHPKILTYKEDSDPKMIIDEVIRLIQGKKSYDSITIGIDPGKTFGIAVLNDTTVIKTLTCSNIEETVNTVINIFKKEESTPNRVLKVGSWAAPYTSELLPMIDAAIPKDVTIEIVHEAGTSHFAGQTAHKRGLKHTIAAIKIAERRGQAYTRSKVAQSQ
jgi:hypothetical protein